MTGNGNIIGQNSLIGRLAHFVLHLKRWDQAVPAKSPYLPFADGRESLPHQVKPQCNTIAHQHRTDDLNGVSARVYYGDKGIRRMIRLNSVEIPHRIFVNLADAAQVAVIDGATHKVTARWPLTRAKDNVPLAFVPESQALLLGCRTPPTALLLNASDGKEIDSVNPPAQAPTTSFTTQPHSVLMSLPGAARSMCWNFVPVS
jgi:hypothetical protein